MDVQSFEESRKLVEKIDKLGIKRLWSRFEESRRACAGSKDRYTKMKVRGNGVGLSVLTLFKKTDHVEGDRDASHKSRTLL